MFAIHLGNSVIPSQWGGNLTVPSKMEYLSKIKVIAHPAWADATTDNIGWCSQHCCCAEKAMKCNDGSQVLQKRPLYHHTKSSVGWYLIDQHDLIFLCFLPACCHCCWIFSFPLLLHNHPRPHPCLHPFLFFEPFRCPVFTEVMGRHAAIGKSG